MCNYSVQKPFGSVFSQVTEVEVKLLKDEQNTE